jgi:NADH-quinone oxidoreductase subunit N
MIHSLIYAVRGFLSGDGALILPEMELVLFACGILLVDRWLAASEKHWNAILALGGIAFSAFTLYVQHGKIQALRGADSESPGLLGFRQSVLVDPFFLFFAALFLAAAALIILLSVRYLEIVEETRGGYYSLLLFACVGAMLMVAGVNLLVVFLGLEILGLSGYILAKFLRREPDATVASRNFAALWVCSSVALGVGFLLLFGLFQTANLGRMGAALEVRLGDGVAFAGLTTWHSWLALSLAAAGSFFLMGAVPFHWFAPGTFENAPAPVAAFLGTIGMTAGFALLLRLFSFLFLFAHEKWLHVWGGLAIVSLLWGNIAALRQTSVKRILAYGAVAQTGFILFGLVAGNEAGFQGMFYYLGVHIFATIGAFGVLIAIQQPGATGLPGSAADYKLADLNGLFRRSPVAALLLLVFLMSLAGIPPTAGFLAKYYLVKALLAVPHPELAVFALINALLSAYYYRRIVAHAFKKQSFNTTPIEALPQERRPLTISNGQTVALTAAVFVTIVAGLYPELFLRLTRYAFGQ